MGKLGSLSSTRVLFPAFGAGHETFGEAGEPGFQVNWFNLDGMIAHIQALQVEQVVGSG